MNLLLIARHNDLYAARMMAIRLSAKYGNRFMVYQDDSHGVWKYSVVTHKGPM